MSALCTPRDLSNRNSSYLSVVQASRVHFCREKVKPTQGSVHRCRRAYRLARKSVCRLGQRARNLSFGVEPGTFMGQRKKGAMVCFDAPDRGAVIAEPVRFRFRKSRLSGLNPRGRFNFVLELTRRFMAVKRIVFIRTLKFGETEIFQNGSNRCVATTSRAREPWTSS
jgi:hypothetical protein